MRNFSPEYKITHPPAILRLAADILRNNPAEQAKFALESYLGGLNYSIAAKYEASNRMLNQHCRFMHRCCRTDWTNM